MHSITIPTTSADASIVDIELYIRAASAKRGSELLIPLNQHRTDLRRFNYTLRYSVKKLGLPRDIIDDELLGLTAFYCTRSKATPTGFLTRLPDGLLNRSFQASPLILATLTRHLVVDIQKISTARDFELARDRSNLASDSPLSGVVSHLHMSQLAEIAFPGVTTGNDPVVRPWLFQEVKWFGPNALEFAGRAAAWVLEYGEKVYERKGQDFNLDEIRKKNWSEAFERHGLKKMVELCKHSRTAFDAVKLGARYLGRSDLFGLRSDQISPWEITHRHMWMRDSGERLIDCVTDSVIQKLRSTDPDLFAKRGKGSLLPQKVKSFGRWTEVYHETATDCLRNSNLSVGEALRRRMPHLFGWDIDQIKPWEMRTKNMWSEKKGLRLFQIALSYTLFRSGLGSFDFQDMCYRFTTDQFNKWYPNLTQKEGGIGYLLQQNHLTGGLKYATAHGSIREAIAILFDTKPYRLPKISARSGERMPTLIRALLKGRDNEFKILFPDFAYYTQKMAAPPKQNEPGIDTTGSDHEQKYRESADYFLRAHLNRSFEDDETPTQRSIPSRAHLFNFFEPRFSQIAELYQLQNIKIDRAIRPYIKEVCSPFNRNLVAFIIERTEESDDETKRARIISRSTEGTVLADISSSTGHPAHKAFIQLAKLIYLGGRDERSGLGPLYRAVFSHNSEKNGEGEYLLSNADLRVILRVLKHDLVNKIDFREDFRPRFTRFITTLLGPENHDGFHSDYPRRILSPAAKLWETPNIIKTSFPTETNMVEVLSQVLHLVGSAVAKEINLQR